MVYETANKDQTAPAAATVLRRRGLLRFGTFVAALSGTSAISTLGAERAHAGQWDSTAAAIYISSSEKGAPFGVPTLDEDAKIPAAQIPDMSAAIASAVALKMDAAEAASSFATKSDVASAATPAVEASREPVGVLTTGFGGAHITNSKTGTRIAIAGTVTDPVQLGVGVKATVDGATRWFSPSGYPRPVETSFLRASLWGSSSAANLGPKLRGVLAPLSMELHFETGAVGAYQATHIAAAMGIRPLAVQAFSIPAVGGTTFTPKNMPEANNTAVPVSWPGTFAGVSGTVSKQAGSATWTFTRHYPGTATSVAEGSEFTPSRPYEFQDGTAFLNLFKNSLTDNTHFGYDECVRLTEKAYDFFAGAGRHVLVIGHYQTGTWVPGTGGFERLEAYNTWCRARYGSRYVDVQGYLSSEKVWTDTGITPTADDLAAQAYPQRIPPSLAQDSMHLNGIGDAAVARLIATKLVELGWTQSYAYSLPGMPAPAVAWNADTLAQVDGSSVSSWASNTATASLINSLEAKSSVASTGRNRFLVKERADGPYTLVNWAQYKTVIVLCKVRDYSDLTLLVNMGGITLTRSTAGNLVLNAGANLVTPMPTDAWGVAAAVIDGASSRVSWNTTTASGNSGTRTAGAFQLSRLNDYAEVSYAAVLLWTEKLTESQVQAVVAALKVAHSSLLT